MYNHELWNWRNESHYLPKSKTVSRNENNFFLSKIKYLKKQKRLDDQEHLGLAYDFLDSVEKYKKENYKGLQRNILKIDDRIHPHKIWVKLMSFEHPL